MLTFQVTIANRATLSGNMNSRIYLDTNNSPNDGCGPNCDGADMVLDLLPGDIAYAPWGGTKWDFSVRSPESLTFSYVSGVATIKVKASELNIPTAFNFWLYADSDYNDVNSSGRSAHIDYAPDYNHGTWSYTSKVTAPVKPTTKAVPKCAKGQKSTAKKPCKK